VRYNFVTCFDSNYAAMGITMLESLYQHCEEANIWVLDLDGQVGAMVAHRFGGRVNLVQLDELLVHQPKLAPLREQRSLWEFYSTLRPVLLRLILTKLPADDALCYVDSDIYFFSSPKCIFPEAKEAAVAISPHRFSAQTRHLVTYGVYNAGLLLVKSCIVGWEVLQDWETKCLAWCHSAPQSGGLFMNQGYLTFWPKQYAGVMVMQHAGVNLAPWNVGTHRIVQVRGAVIIVDGLPLVCFHFSSLWRNEAGSWQTYDLYSAIHRDAILNGMYARYILALESNAQALKQRWGGDGIARTRHRSSGAYVIIQNAQYCER
jgi:hypothetical protein